MDELSDFDDYVKLLITHEFTHVAHLDTILSWCPRLIDSVLGKIYAPNLSQPTLFIEGLAVLMESRQTTAGRLRSSFYDMHLRVPFLEGRVLGLDAVSVGYGPLVYPGGSVPYLYGSSILRYIEDRYGPEKVREISHRYADECIAGGINRIAWEARRPPLHRRVRRRPLARLGPFRGAPLRAAEGRGRAARPDHGAAPHHRRAVAARDLAAAGVLPRRNAGLPAREQRPGAAYVRLDLATEGRGRSLDGLWVGEDLDLPELAHPLARQDLLSSRPHARGDGEGERLARLLAHRCEVIRHEPQAAARQAGRERALAAAGRADDQERSPRGDDGARVEPEKLGSRTDQDLDDLLLERADDRPETALDAAGRPWRCRW